MCFGHRKLIQLSPKKTWEGFIGGCLTTVVASWYLAGFLSRFKWMTCPRTVQAQPPSPLKCHILEWFCGLDYALAVHLVQQAARAPQRACMNAVCLQLVLVQAQCWRSCVFASSPARIEGSRGTGLCSLVPTAGMYHSFVPCSPALLYAES